MAGPRWSNHLHIRHMANTIDPPAGTFAFYLPLDQPVTQLREGRQDLCSGGFGPASRSACTSGRAVHNVFVLPAEAVVPRGREAYVFRQNGDFFDRKPVRVLYQDRSTWSSPTTAASPGHLRRPERRAQLNRVLKAQSGRRPRAPRPPTVPSTPTTNGELAMLNAVIRFALRYRTLVIVLSLAVLVYGGYLTTTLPIDVFPDLDRPRVVIMTECPGLAPEEVETLVTHPIESACSGRPACRPSAASRAPA